MNTGFSIRPRVISKRTPEGGHWAAYGEVAEYLKSLEPVLKTSVQQKMRRGVSPYDFSERASVQTSISLDKDRLNLRVFSNSVRAAVDETGATYGGIPPYGPGSALLEWVIQKLDTANPKWTARRVALAIHSRGLPRPGDVLRRPFATTHQELAPQIRLGIAQTRARVARRINAPSAGL